MNEADILAGRTAVIEEPTPEVVVYPKPPLATEATRDEDALICAKCQTIIGDRQGWCKRCGWYPRLRTFVELDPWEREDLPQPKPLGKIESLRTFIKPWGRKMLAGVAVIFAASVIVRILLPEYGPTRFHFTVAQMAIGLLVMLAGHVGCFLFAVMENDRLTMLDMILRPLTIWMAVVRELPETFYRVAFGVWGAALIVGGLIVGGLSDRDLIDWGGTPARSSLLKSIDLAKQGEGSGDLAKSIEDFANQAGQVTDGAAKALKPKIVVDCLIIGYEPLGVRDFASLIIAAEVRGSLASVGTVSDGIPSEVRDEILQRLPKLVQAQPLVHCRLDGKWLRPVMTCRVGAQGWTTSNKLSQPRFIEMLADVPSK